MPSTCLRIKLIGATLAVALFTCYSLPVQAVRVKSALTSAADYSARNGASMLNAAKVALSQQKPEAAFALASSGLHLEGMNEPVNFLLRTELIEVLARCHVDQSFARDKIAEAFASFQRLPAKTSNRLELGLRLAQAAHIVRAFDLERDLLSYLDKDGGNARIRTNVELLSGRLAYARLDYADAREHFQRALEAAVELSPDTSLEPMLTEALLGWTYIHQDNLKQASHMFLLANSELRRYITFAVDHSDAFQIGQLCTEGLRVCEMRNGSDPAAVEAVYFPNFEPNMARNPYLDPQDRAMIKGQIALHALKNFDWGESSADSADASSDKFADPPPRQFALLGRELQRPKLLKLKKQLQEALEYSTSAPVPSTTTMVALLDGLSEVAMHLNNFTDAESYVHRAIALLRKTEPSNTVALAKQNSRLGYEYIMNGQYELAQNYLTNARLALERGLEAASNPDEKADIELALANAYYRLACLGSRYNDVAGSAQLLQQALDKIQAQTDRQSLLVKASALGQLGRLRFAQFQPAAGLALYQQQQQLAEKLKIATRIYLFNLHHDMALNCHMTAMVPECIKECDIALAMVPSVYQSTEDRAEVDRQLLYIRAQAHDASGDAGRAKEDYQKAASELMDAIKNATCSSKYEELRQGASKVLTEIGERTRTGVNPENRAVWKRSNFPLKYFIDGESTLAPGNKNQVAVAFSTWQEAGNGLVSFCETKSAGNADIVVKLEEHDLPGNKEGMTYSEDLRGRHSERIFIHLHTSVPNVELFKADEGLDGYVIPDRTWETSRSPNSEWSLKHVGRIAVHEIGHALGLDHSPLVSDVMFKYSRALAPSKNDLACLSALYAARKATAPRKANANRNSRRS